MFNLKALVKMLQGLLWINELVANDGKYEEYVEEGRTGRLVDMWKKGMWEESGWLVHVAGYQIQRARTEPETGDFLVDTERFYLRRWGYTWYVYHGFAKDGRFPGSYQNRPSPYGLVLAFELRDGKIMEKQVEVVFRKELEAFRSILEKKDQPDRETHSGVSWLAWPVNPEEVGGDKYDPL